MMLKVYAIVLLTFAITLTTTESKEEETENGPQSRYQVYGGVGSPQTYYFGYDSKAKDAPRLMREETRLPDGTVQGRYGYTDPFGVFRVVKYVSGNNGYYATEEIGEQVTSSTPQYFKATAPQVESVSEQPVPYAMDLVAKFNPPLYHPEAHTMAPDDNPVTGEGGVDTNNKNHQIFSLSNSEDILEKKYRERKQLERNLRESVVNVEVKQTISKRVGTSPLPSSEQLNSETPDQQNLSNRRVKDEDKQNTKPLIRQNNENNNKFFRRAPIEYLSPNTSETPLEAELKRNKQGRSQSNNNQNKNETNSERKEKFTDSSVFTPSSPVIKHDEHDHAHYATEVVPKDVDHLYYSPTRSPVISYSTSVSRVINDNKSDSEDKHQNTSERDDHKDVWTKIRELFRTGSPTTTETVPTTSSDIPNNTTPNEDILRQNDTKRKEFNPIFISDDSEVFRALPIEIENEDMSKYLDQNPFFINHDIILEANPHETERVQNNSDNSENITVFITDKDFSETIENIDRSHEIPERSIAHNSTTDNTLNYESTTESTAPGNGLKVIFSDFFIDPIHLSSEYKKEDEEKQNLSSGPTKSAFHHDLWFNQDQKVGQRITNNSNDTLRISHTSESTIDYSLQNRNQRVLRDQTTETPSHPSDERFLEDFWKTFDEKSILFSEAQVENYTKSEPNPIPFINDTNDWLSERIDKNSIMFSEGRVEDLSTTQSSIETILTTTETQTTLLSETTTEAITQTTYETTTPSGTTSEISTETPSTTTIPKTTTTDLINKEFLDNFWHHFNDNSDEYVDPFVDNKTNAVTESTAYAQQNVTTHQISLNIDSEKNVTQIEKTFPEIRRQDLDSSEGMDSLNYTAVEEKALPLVQPSDQNQYIPPLSAIFEFPHIRKRMRRVQRLRTTQTTPLENQLVSTTSPEESEKDIMSTDATEELTAISDEDSTHLKTTASQRYYQYIPPYPVLRQNYLIKETQPVERSSNGIPVLYSQAFDDMSDIVTTIESMRKPNRPQSEETDPQKKSSEKAVRFDDNPDSYVAVIPPKPQLRAQNRRRVTYLLPIEPQREEEVVRHQTTPEVIEINRIIPNSRAVHRYEPIIRLDV